MDEVAKALCDYMQVYEIVKKQREKDFKTLTDGFLEHRAIQRDMEQFNDPR